jgi:hypothetical protein
VVVPQIHPPLPLRGLVPDTELHWADEAIVAYSPVVDHNYWASQQTIGTISGAQFNSLAAWVVQWQATHATLNTVDAAQQCNPCLHSRPPPGQSPPHSAHRNPSSGLEHGRIGRAHHHTEHAAWQATHSHYQPWDVWDRPTLGPETTVYWNSTVCDSFSQAAIAQLAASGAALSHEPIRRNYAPLISQQPLHRVDMANAGQRAQVATYYLALGRAGQLIQSKTGSQSEMKQVLDSITRGGVAFIHDGESGDYWRVTLSKPHHHGQHISVVRDVAMLPWQHNHA